MPEGWCWTTIDTISESILYGVSESAKTKGEYKLLRITDIQNGHVDWQTVPYTDYDCTKANQYLLRENDILFARTGATVGKSYLTTNTPSNTIYASYLIRVRPGSRLLPQYVKYYFESGYYWEQISIKSVGVGQPNVNGSVLGELSIPIPPFAEQERIVMAATKFLHLIDAVEEEQKSLSEDSLRIKEQVLDLAIHGKLVPQVPSEEPAIELLLRINPAFKASDNLHYIDSIPAGWVCCPLYVVCEILDSQRKPINSKEREKRVEKATTLFPYYGATGQVGVIDDYIFDGNYLLLGEDGAPFLDRYAKKAYPVSGKIWVNNHAHILSPRINAMYMMCYLNAINYRPYVTGTTRLKLTQEAMRSIPVLVPPLAEQERITSRIDILFHVIDAIQLS